MMKIAQIAPLYESVPPKLYGGTERIVSYLTEELVARNHDVTLFASADSVTRARLVQASESALRLSQTRVVDAVAHHIRLLELVFREAHQFDIFHLPSGRLSPLSQLFTAIFLFPIWCLCTRSSERWMWYRFRIRSDNHYPGLDGPARSITASRKIYTTFMNRQANTWPSWGESVRKSASIARLKLPRRLGAS